MTDAQVAEVANHHATGLRSAEVEALDNLPDETIKHALNELSEDQSYGGVLRGCGGVAL
ncbi:MAG: hypothetical protein U1U88_002009 [Lawsonella clevelandensis]